MNAAGTAAGAANQNTVGIQIANSTSNRIGGTTASARNVICGSINPGVRLTDNANSNIVEGNLIGVRPDGTALLGNALEFTFSARRTMSSEEPAHPAGISFGNGAGVVLVDVAAPGDNQIANNYIGLDRPV
jgi:hypothetical protein